MQLRESSYMEKFRNGSQVTSKITFRSLRNTLPTPGNEDVLRKTGIWILDLQKCKLNFAF